MTVQYLVLDYGGTEVKIALMDEEANVLKSDNRPSPVESYEAMLQFARGIAAEYRGMYEGVAVSMPGMIDVENGIAHVGSPYVFERNTPFGKIYSEIFGAPTVIANDGKCAANAELYKGALKGVKSGAVIALGTGIAGGIVVDGKIWTGFKGAAGEVSFLPHDYSRLISLAKKVDAQRGELTEKDMYELYFSTWEYTASTTGLLYTYSRHSGIPYSYGDTHLNGKLFFEKYDQQEKAARDALDEFAMNVAAGIFSLQITLDAERYAIGGGITARPEVTEKIREAYEKIAVLQPEITKPEIVPCTFHNGANQIGALMFFFEQQLEKIKN